MAKADRYRLDNVGTFYAAEAGGATQTVFRFAATMADEVDPAALQLALDQTVALFPSFNVCLRNGFFWHYLEPAKELPRVEPENVPICFGLHVGPQSTLFRVSWEDARINFEVSHIISDGRGSFKFFQALIGLYAQARYGAPYVDAEGEAASEARSQQAEDSFSRNYDRSLARPTPSKRAFQLPDLRDARRPAYMECHLSADQVLARARSLGVSVTALIIAAVICAIRDQMAPRDRRKPIRMDVPVDLRQLFGSETMRNFFGLAFISYTPGRANEPLEAIAEGIHQQIVDSCSPDAIKGRMNRMIKLQRNPLIRMAPLFIKDMALEVAARMTAHDVTTTVSSLGRLAMPDSAAPFVRSVSVLTSSKGLNFVVCTFGDDLSIGISTIYRRHPVVQSLCRILAEHQLPNALEAVTNGQQRRVSKPALGT